MPDNLTDREEAIMAVLQGVPVEVMAKELDISEATIYRWMREGGHTKQVRKMRYRKAVNMYLEGRNVMDIREELQMSPRTLYDILEKYDVPLRQPGYTEEDEQEIVNMYKAGATLERIRTECNTCNETIYGILEKHGVRTRQYSIRRGE